MQLGDQQGALTPCDDSRVQREKKDSSSFLAKTHPMKSYGLFYYGPPNFLFLYKSTLRLIIQFMHLGKWISKDYIWHHRFHYSLLRNLSLGRSQDGGGVGRGEHFLPHKFIKRAFKRRVNSTKQLLNAGRGHQAPRKAAQLFERR